MLFIDSLDFPLLTFKFQWFGWMIYVKETMCFFFWYPQVIKGCSNLYVSHGHDKGRTESFHLLIYSVSRPYNIRAWQVFQFFTSPNYWGYDLQQILFQVIRAFVWDRFLVGYARLRTLRDTLCEVFPQEFPQKQYCLSDVQNFLRLGHANGVASIPVPSASQGVRTPGAHQPSLVAYSAEQMAAQRPHRNA